MRNVTITSTVGGILVAGIAALAMAAATGNGSGTAYAGEGARMDTVNDGTWVATHDGDGGDRLRLELRWGSVHWGRSFARSDLQGLSDGDLAFGGAAVSFRLEREPGTFEMEGTFHDGSGSGRFRFRTDRSFATTLRSLGIDDAEGAADADLMVLAWNDASAAAVDELTALGLERLTLRDVIDIFIHGITPSYMSSLHSAGLAGTGTVRGLVELRISRITAEYVRELEAVGYGGLDHHQLLEMGTHGVSPAFIREMGEAGLRGLSPRELAQLRIARVTLEGIRELEALGYRGLTQSQLVEMGLHGVTPAFIREMREAGFADLSPEGLVKLKIYRIR